MTRNEVEKLLILKANQYNSISFIENDPISIPHRFSKSADIEIAGYFAATLAWGQRKTIINNCSLILELMDKAPHDFIINHKDNDLKKFLNFKHRTFNSTDLLYFIYFLREHYKKFPSLEYAFLNQIDYSENILKPIKSIYELSDKTLVEYSLVNFHRNFFSLEYFPNRTRKHVSTPLKKSACKRLNMYLRWMVRKDNEGVDFGIWKDISPKNLICPLDIHVQRVARDLKLLKRKQNDFESAKELTNSLQKFDKEDPVRFDFALFGLGLERK